MTSITPRYPAADWDEITNFWPGNAGRRAVAIHIAAGGYKSSITHMRNNGKSAHFITAFSGEVSQMVEIQDSAWANGLSFDDRRMVWVCPHGKVVKPTWRLISTAHNPNKQTISIEHEGMSGQKAPQAQLDATIDLLVWLGTQYPELTPYVVGSTLIGHCDLDPRDKSGCPGTGISLPYLAREANARLSGNWRGAWAAKGVQLPAAQENWAIPALYRQHYAALGACLRAEDYLVPGFSVAIFERGFIYYVQSKNTAYVVNGFAL